MADQHWGFGTIMAIILGFIVLFLIIFAFKADFSDFSHNVFETLFPNKTMNLDMLEKNPKVLENFKTNLEIENSIVNGDYCLQKYSLNDFFKTNSKELIVWGIGEDYEPVFINEVLDQSKKTDPQNALLPSNEAVLTQGPISPLTKIDYNLKLEYKDITLNQYAIKTYFKTKDPCYISEEELVDIDKIIADLKSQTSSNTIFFYNTDIQILNNDIKTNLFTGVANLWSSNKNKDKFSVKYLGNTSFYFISLKDGTKCLFIPKQGITIGSKEEQELDKNLCLEYQQFNTQGEVVGSVYTDTTKSTSHIASANLIDFLKKTESYQQFIYDDGKGNPTIGYGHLLKSFKTQTIQIEGNQYTIGTKTTGYSLPENVGTKLFAQDLKNYENYVKQYVTVPLTQGQYDALVSFTFNAGSGSLHELITNSKLNTGTPEAYDLTAEKMGEYVHGDNKDCIPGLVTRREKEATWFLGRTIEFQGCVPSIVR